MREHLLVIGASTGGPSCITDIVRQFQPGFPGAVAAMHMHPACVTSFAEQLNRSCTLDVREARAGDVVRSGRLLIAPGGRHAIIRRVDHQYVVLLDDGPPFRHPRPSIDKLFLSAERAAGRSAIGVLLTGMGDDGAQGMLKIRQTGGLTIAESQETCTVFGMPRSAIALEAATDVLPRHQIALRISRALAVESAHSITAPF